MILIDVGNTNIVFAASANNLLKKIKRIKTNEGKKRLKNLINKIILDFASIINLIITMLQLFRLLCLI